MRKRKPYVYRDGKMLQAPDCCLVCKSPLRIDWTLRRYVCPQSDEHTRNTNRVLRRGRIFDIALRGFVI